MVLEGEAIDEALVDGAHSSEEDQREAAAAETMADEAAADEVEAEEIRATLFDSEDARELPAAHIPVRHVSFSAGQAASLLGLRGKGPKRFRHRKRLRDNIQGVTKASIRKLARRAGVKRISGLIYEETRTQPMTLFPKSSMPGLIACPLFDSPSQVVCSRSFSRMSFAMPSCTRSIAARRR